MCRRIQCDRCARPSFAGCGAHIEQVLGDVPKDKRCRCGESVNDQAGAKKDSKSASWLRGLLGR